LWLTAALYEQMVAHQPQALAGVSQVLAGGDVLPAHRVREHLARMREGAVLINGYGPTENTTFSATHTLRAGDEVLRSVPIGRPLPHSTTYVLDEAFQPLPPGVPGELFVGGEGLAWGYLNRPDLTAERFVPHPFASTPGARLYRTGDKVRWTADGTLEFLGRTDFQVKVRGFRIELGEIEAVLRQFSGIQETVAVVREDVPGDKRIVAYLVPTTPGLDTSALRGFMQQRLPEYMVPSAFVEMAALPLSSNGKVDRRALPAPDFAAASSEDFVAPRSELETKLADIFAGVLGVERVGLHGDFFDLGGHSLLATQVVSRIRATLNVELPLGELFSAPTVALLAERLQQRTTTTQQPALVPVERTQALPLSFAQQRLWFLDQLQPGSAFYNIPWALKFDGTLDVTALHRALSALGQRHEVLRTTFVVRDGAPTQQIHPEVRLELPVVDLSTLTAAQREDEARRLAHEEAQRPFDLAQGPLVRTTLVRLAPEQHLLLVTLHHIVSDGWSIAVMVRELGAYYRQFTGGEPATLAPLPVQYADYSVWQRQWLTGDTLKQELGWWREQLAGASHALELPTDRPRPALQTYRGAELPVPLSRELSEAVKALARREGATPFMVLLASLQLLLSRYSGQDDISVGSPIANRNRAETEGLIGFFINTLVLRARIDSRQSFRELLAQVRERTLAAYEHQDVPFEKLVEELQPQRDLSRSPLFQVTLTLQNAPTNELRLPGLTLSPQVTASDTSKYDFSLLLDEGSEGFTGLLNYNTDLFDAATAERMMRHYAVLLEAVVAAPERQLGLLPLLTDAERQQVVTEWSGTPGSYPSDTSLAELFAQQARSTPEAVALVFGDEQLTYAQLDQRANQLANYLRGLGVQAGSRVAVRLERSVDLVVGLLGVLKAGAAYVPLDKGWPTERVTFALQQSAAGVLLTQSELADELPDLGSVLVVMDEEGARIARQSDSAPVVAAGGTDLAYVMFTSGSTGQPKGVCVPHRAIARLVKSNSFMRFGPQEVWLQAAPIAFDASTLEVWGALLNGAKLVLAPAHSLSLEELGAELVRHGVTSLWLTAALYEQMVAHQSEALTTVSQVLAGGDVLPAHRVREHLARMPEGAVLINGYGPTENTTFSATHALKAGDEVPRSVPIGRPLPHSTTYVLDEAFQPLPPGVPGELFVGGEGLAWGYLNRPDLTAERFVPHPFASTPGARLYRTGDKVRWTADGTLEFLGRTDFQVKVRGFRIELGEVEAVLRQFSGIQETVAVVREDVPGDKRIVAYLVPATPGLDISALRGFMQQRLPEYMVPSAFVEMAALPLSSNGKVDRRALPAPDFAAASSEDFVAPRTELETKLAGIFAGVLGVERVGLHGDFFDLGGHSLLATQVVSRIRATLNVELPLGELFSAPTVALLAERLQQRTTTTQQPALVPVERSQALPLSFAQQRLWFIDQLQPGSAAYNIPWVLKLEGTLDVAALHQTLHALRQRHEVLRTTFVVRDGAPTQHVHAEAWLELPLVDLSSRELTWRDEEARKLAREEAQRPFDLAQGPLVRTTLVRLAPEQHLLLVTLHHIVSDGWSIAVMVRELGAYYRQFTGGEPATLASLPVQYADYASWQRQWLQGEVLEQELGWWRQQLAGASHALELPTDRPRPAVQTYRGAVVSAPLSRELSEAVKALARREGATPFMVLLASLQLLLSRYSGQDDVSVGSPIANRNRAETEGLIGFFINTLVLRARIDSRQSFRELLAQVRERTLAAYEHQDVPFEKLVEELQPQRDLSRSPLFQVTLTLQNAPTNELALPGLTLSALAPEIDTSKYDFSLVLDEGSEGFAGVLNYNTDLFDAGTAQRLMRHYAVLLEAVVAAPERQLGLLPVLTEAERQQVVTEWSGRLGTYPSDTSLADLFTQQARQTPDAVALVSGDEQLTYAQLDARANQLANYLQTLGVQAGGRVAVRLERSVDLVVGLLAILKAGAAYVPLDKGWPTERVTFVLQQSAAGVLLTQSDLADELPDLGSVLVVMDEEGTRIGRQPESAPAIHSGGSALAYVMFTSGSTGQPKGVCVPHRAVARLVKSNSFMRFGPQEVWLQAAPVAFDASTLEVWGALLNGAKLVLAPAHSLSLEELGAELVRHGVTSLWLTAALYEQMVAHQSQALAGVSQVLAGGDVLPAHRVREHLARMREGAVLINGYGPTENTTFSATHTLKAGDEVPRSVPIGRPLPHSTTYVLDEAFQPLPPGVPGELFVGGEGLAWGYLNRPDLTAERFVPHPFASTPGARLYRTGDKVRWTADGTLEFLGRTDFQVKVRGF
ncbi:non-ribosomal peptide synthetase, partial [Pyxidicoccus xibeiensis]|uniref:non-ribosomal peptide synthetase n=1 Tax=Pyxidicoccus xibeiensis TaxID=2906759 RepID=UPI0020A80200